jgi:hypothetical protein
VNLRGRGPLPPSADRFISELYTVKERISESNDRSIEFTKLRCKEKKYFRKE